MKETRLTLTAENFLEIREPQVKKDPNFYLCGIWKKYAFQLDEFYVFGVDVPFIQKNIDRRFGHGGHSLLFDFINDNDLWISISHFDGCGCGNCHIGQDLSKRMFDSMAIHLREEYRLMKSGTQYTQAHMLADEKEFESQLLNCVNTEHVQPYTSARMAYYLI
jgi:hypothetical protein